MKRKRDRSDDSDSGSELKNPKPRKRRKLQKALKKLRKVIKSLEKYKAKGSCLKCLLEEEDIEIGHNHEVCECDIIKSVTDYNWDGDRVCSRCDHEAVCDKCSSDLEKRDCCGQQVCVDCCKKCLSCHSYICCRCEHSCST